MVTTRARNRVNQSLGIRADEGTTVRLFFGHNFLLGIGTVLVYVTATLLLLENHPETNLPLAYIASGLGMMAVGKIYAHFEHHLALRQLVTRVLWSVIILTGVIGVLVAFGHSVVTAIAIMVGYRSIYLLTNLEFWAVSALVFDVRQSKRLFGVISSGDMPAKAIGAILAALIHGHGPLLWLLLLAFACYGAALLITNQTLRLHDVEATARPARATQRPIKALVNQLFGGSDLIFAVCLTLVPVAMLAAGIEYEFFVNVKHKFHDQGDVMGALGRVLAATYLLAMGVKALFSRRALDRFGIPATLTLLPAVAGLGLLAYGLLAGQANNDQAQLVYYSLLYVGFEVVRRAIFDPVLLVLFQPLPPQQRLKGHTLGKGFYEPLGMTLAGVALYLVALLGERTYGWLLLGGGLLALALLLLTRRTYRRYVLTLQDALSHRFVAPDSLAMPQAATAFIETALASPNALDVLNAIDYIPTLPPEEQQRHIGTLLRHPDAQVRQQAMALTDTTAEHLPTLAELAQQDPDPDLRRYAAEQLAQQATTADGAAWVTTREAVQRLLTTADQAGREGAIIGALRSQPADKAAVDSLVQLINSPDSADQITALHCLATTPLARQEAFVQRALTDATLVEAALPAAAQYDAIRPALTTFLTNRHYWRSASEALIALGDEALPLLPRPSLSAADAALVRRLAVVAGRVGTEAGRQWLLTYLADAPFALRGPLLTALKEYDPDAANAPLYHRLMADEAHLAQRLLQGLASTANPALASALTYETTVVTDRLLLLLMGLTDRQTVQNARQSLYHQTTERRANSLELLENLILSAKSPRSVYAALLALTDTALPLPDRLRLLAPHVDASPTPILDDILTERTQTFTNWTVLMAQAATPPDSYHPTPTSMHHATDTATVSTIERVFLLKNSRLFADTPANVLASIAPIMKEVTFSEGEAIVRQGDIGTSLFVLFDGQVGVYTGDTLLAQLGRGDVFGELALLDAEPRSATVTAQGDVLAFRIDQDDFYDLMEERPEVLRNIISLLSRRIRTLNQGK
ncbi:putative transcriptional regulator, Crp/Fnr family [Fibrella aestuarina BUZ 2]|uniref:Putative transcriptional regulator, Crp/Fnr family n=1 Tax=Fibrella aestuarina BUZ 2 TaxID=1166018 RepID=I0KDN2_9BACT|nr:cyclic nucleotide-binding domain-containing protein [Fibrella aestuarina]CCH02235.1 putative transcriptional regulator, Crp/Fnr family [Fibrella aestuarina BUZ 2]